MSLFGIDILIVGVYLYGEGLVDGCSFHGYWRGSGMAFSRAIPYCSRLEGMEMEVESQLAWISWLGRNSGGCYVYMGCEVCEYTVLSYNRLICQTVALWCCPPTFKCRWNEQKWSGSTKSTPKFGHVLFTLPIWLYCSATPSHGREELYPTRWDVCRSPPVPYPITRKHVYQAYRSRCCRSLSSNIVKQNSTTYIAQMVLPVWSFFPVCSFCTTWLHAHQPENQPYLSFFFFFRKWMIWGTKLSTPGTSPWIRV